MIALRMVFHQSVETVLYSMDIIDERTAIVRSARGQRNTRYNNHHDHNQLLPSYKIVAPTHAGEVRDGIRLGH